VESEYLVSGTGDSELAARGDGGGVVKSAAAAALPLEDDIKCWISGDGNNKKGAFIFNTDFIAARLLFAWPRLGCFLPSPRQRI
jgi:hypothetical protein